MWRLPGYLNVAEHRAQWLWALLGTAVMALFFSFTLDGGTLARAWRSMPLASVVCAFVLLGVNGLLDAWWLNTMTPGHAQRGTAYRVMAWHLLLTSILPARLGDLGWIYFVHRWLGHPPARAIFVTFYHRLQDFIVVSVLMITALVALRPDLVTWQIASVTFGLLATLLAGVAFLDRSFGMLARCLIQCKQRQSRRRLRRLLAQLLRVRVWYRHRLSRKQIAQSFAIIVLRWVTIMAALAIVIAALAPGLTATDSFFLANAYVYLGIIPLQSFGGFGSGEAGLAWLLTEYGFGLTQASAVGVVVRLLINGVHVLLWLGILAVLAVVAWRRR